VEPAAFLGLDWDLLFGGGTCFIRWEEKEPVLPATTVIVGPQIEKGWELSDTAMISIQGWGRIVGIEGSMVAESGNVRTLFSLAARWPSRFVEPYATAGIHHLPRNYFQGTPYHSFGSETDYFVSVWLRVFTSYRPYLFLAVRYLRGGSFFTSSRLIPRQDPDNKQNTIQLIGGIGIQL